MRPLRQTCSSILFFDILGLTGAYAVPEQRRSPANSTPQINASSRSYGLQRQ